MKAWWWQVWLYRYCSSDRQLYGWLDKPFSQWADVTLDFYVLVMIWILIIATSSQKHVARSPRLMFTSPPAGNAYASHCIGSSYAREILWQIVESTHCRRTTAGDMYQHAARARVFYREIPNNNNAPDGIRFLPSKSNIFIIRLALHSGIELYIIQSTSFTRGNFTGSHCTTMLFQKIGIKF